MTLTDALQEMRPNAEWTMTGDTYAGLNWIDAVQTKPTEAEINTYITDNLYKEQRRKAYPPIGDQLDALWKGGQAQTDMLALINAVKTTYPKP